MKVFVYVSVQAGWLEVHVGRGPGVIARDAERSGMRMRATTYISALVLAPASPSGDRGEPKHRSNPFRTRN